MHKLQLLHLPDASSFIFNYLKIIFIGNLINPILFSLCLMEQVHKQIYILFYDLGKCLT